MILYFTTQISISEKYRMFYCALCMRVCAIVEKKSGSRLVFGQNSKSGKILRRLDLCACLLALVYVCLCVCMCVCACVCVCVCGGGGGGGGPGLCLVALAHPSWLGMLPAFAEPVLNIALHCIPLHFINCTENKQKWPYISFNRFVALNVINVPPLQPNFITFLYSLSIKGTPEEKNHGIIWELFPNGRPPPPPPPRKPLINKNGGDFVKESNSFGVILKWFEGYF